MLSLFASTIDLWLLSFSESTATSVNALADLRDRQRCEEIAIPRRRRGFIFRRYSLRYVLNHYLSHYNIEPDDNGKPRIRTPKGDPPLHFSSSSSGNLCAIAVCSNEVGLDLELSHSRIDMIGIYKHFVSSFDAGLNALSSEQLTNYLALLEWCRLEALTKLKGFGLHRMLFKDQERLYERLHSPELHYAMVADTDYVCVIAQERPIRLNRIYERRFEKMDLL